MGAAASPLSFAATGLGALGRIDAGDTASQNAIQQGQQTAEMDEFRAQQLKDAASFGRTQASQTDAFMKQRLITQLGNIMAVRGSANTDASSPTGMAIAAREQGQGDQERDIRVGNLNAQAAESDSESAMYTKAAQETLNSAYANSSSDFLSGLLGGAGSLFTGLSGIKPGA